jgi:membrane-associated phospholipid phosphatase
LNKIDHNAKLLVRSGEPPREETMNRRRMLLCSGAALVAAGHLVLPVHAAPQITDPASEALQGWYRLVLSLVRHTATYSPPVASRSFAYLGVTAYQVVCSQDPSLNTLAGQLNGFGPPPAAPGSLNLPLALHGAMEEAVNQFFGNTGPTGQRVMKAAAARWREKFRADVSPAEADAALAYGKAVALHVLEWSKGDGGADVPNMGFPLDYTLGAAPHSWRPTSAIPLQQFPLLPAWGGNRPFAMPEPNACPLPPPPAYSEEPGSAFHDEAMEVHTVTSALTPEQKAIARFWSDDPMLSPTPPGHWVDIVLQIAARDGMAAKDLADVLARLGVAVADAFIGNWHTKYEYDLLRPVTYIRKVIDKNWKPLLITPPFPEYPSGHSTQSGAAEAVLTAFFGENFAFEDATHVKEGFAVRRFSSFREAAEEAGISRLYGGIHFRAAIDRGLEQGRCIGAHAVGLKTRTA